MNGTLLRRDFRGKGTPWLNDLIRFVLKAKQVIICHLEDDRG